MGGMGRTLVRDPLGVAHAVDGGKPFGVARCHRFVRLGNEPKIGHLIHESRQVTATCPKRPCGELYSRTRFVHWPLPL